MASFLCCQPLALQSFGQLDFGNVAQWVAAFCTILAILVALFKESILGLCYRPVLELSIKLGPPDCHKMRYASSDVGYYFRFWVRNCGNRVAHDVQVYASKLKTKLSSENEYSEVSSFLPMCFVWSYGGDQPSITAGVIPQGIGKHCDFGHVIGATSEILYADTMDCGGKNTFNLDLEFPASTGNAKLNPGDYVLDVVVAAGNAKPKKYSISFTYNGKWSNSAEVMFSKHFQLHSVSPQ